MRVDFESEQPIEVVTASGDVSEASIIVGLECIDPGFSGSFDPRTGGEPPHGPEFDIVYIALKDAEGNSREFGPLEIMENILTTLLGWVIYENIIDAAMYDASYNWVDNSYEDA